MKLIFILQTSKLQSAIINIAYVGEGNVLQALNSPLPSSYPFAPFQTILYSAPEPSSLPPSLPHIQTKPFSGSLMLFNKVYKTLPNLTLQPHAQAPPCPPQYVPGTSLGSALQDATLPWLCVFICGCPCGPLPIHSLTNTAIKQPPGPLLVSATQKTFSDLPKSTLGGFPCTPTAHCTSLIRGSASHGRSGLVMPIHTALWLGRGSYQMEE